MTDKDKLEKLKKLADAMYYAAQYLTTDASRLHKAMDEYHKFIINEYHKEEPTIPDIVDEHFHEMLGEEHVSEDLEEASKEWLRPQLDKSYANYGEVKMMELTHFDGYAMLDAIEFGAEWQKTKDESTTKDLGDYINELSKQFPEVSFAKLSRVAVRVAKWQKQQDQSTIELAEDHAYFAGRTKTMDETKEALLSEVLPCFMHGGEADEVVAKLDEVLNQKK